MQTVKICPIKDEMGMIIDWEITYEGDPDECSVNVTPSGGPNFPSVSCDDISCGGTCVLKSNEDFPCFIYWCECSGG